MVFVWCDEFCFVSVYQHKIFKRVYHYLTVGKSTTQPKVEHITITRQVKSQHGSDLLHRPLYPWYVELLDCPYNRDHLPDKVLLFYGPYRNILRRHTAHSNVILIGKVVAIVWTVN